jgi:hypothetical protein
MAFVPRQFIDITAMVTLFPNLQVLEVNYISESPGYAQFGGFIDDATRTQYRALNVGAQATHGQQ